MWKTEYWIKRYGKNKFLSTRQKFHRQPNLQWLAACGIVAGDLPSTPKTIRHIKTMKNKKKSCRRLTISSTKLMISSIKVISSRKYANNSLVIWWFIFIKTFRRFYQKYNFMWPIHQTWNFSITHTKQWVCTEKPIFLTRFLGCRRQPSFFVLRVDDDPRYNKWGSPSTLSRHKLFIFFLSSPNPIQCGRKPAQTLRESLSSLSKSSTSIIREEKLPKHLSLSFSLFILSLPLTSLPSWSFRVQRPERKWINSTCFWGVTENETYIYKGFTKFLSTSNCCYFLSPLTTLSNVHLRDYQKQKHQNRALNMKTKQNQSKLNLKNIIKDA